MTQKQKNKHSLDRADKFLVEAIVVPTGPTPDGLGRWKGGLKRSSTLLQRKRATQFASNKNTPGKSSSEVVEPSAEWLRGGRRVKKVVDTRFGYDTDMVKPYEKPPTD